MMRFLVALLLIGLAGQAHAQRAGVYAMNGIGMDGQPYQGSAVLRQTGRETWRMTWTSGEGSEPLEGIGLSANGILTMGFLLSGEPGAAWYFVMPDGSLEGRWTSGHSGRVGTERLAPK